MAGNACTGGRCCTAAYKLEEGDPEGDLSIVVQAGYTDITGNKGLVFGATPNSHSQLQGTYVEVDTNKPTVTLTSIVSSNTDTTRAKVDDTITLTFTSTEDLSSTLGGRQLPQVTLAG